MMANGDKIEDLLEDYPSLERYDIFACLNYGASLAEEQITPIQNKGEHNGFVTASGVYCRNRRAS